MDYAHFLAEVKHIAVVGATGDQQKYGWWVLTQLATIPNLDIFGVNPHYTEIAQIPCYESLYNCPINPDLVVTVVPPIVTPKIVTECSQLGIHKIWMQPGSESLEAIHAAQNNQLMVISKACIVVDGYHQQPR